MRKPRKAKARSQFYTLTIFKFDDLLKQIVDSKKEIVYTILGYEVCPNTGRPHVQAYVVFRQSLTRRQVINVFKESYAEIAKGTPLENYKYCSKDGKFFQYGSYRTAVNMFVDPLYDPRNQPSP